MFRRFQDALLHPRYIGMYIKDKIIYIICYLLILCLVSLVPPIMNIVNSEMKLSSSYQDTLVYLVREKAPEGALFNGTSFEGESFSVTFQDMYILYFNCDADEVKKSQTTNTIVFSNEGIVHYVGLTKINTQSYENIKYFSFDDIKKGDVVQRDQFLKLMDYAFLPYISSSMPVSIALVVLEYIGYAILNVVFIMLLSIGVAQMKFEFRLKIALYALTPYFVCALFAGLFDAVYLIYVGAFLAYIASSLAYRSVRIVEVRKPKE